MRTGSSQLSAAHVEPVAASQRATCVGSARSSSRREWSAAVRPPCVTPTSVGPALVSASMRAQWHAPLALVTSPESNASIRIEPE